MKDEEYQKLILRILRNEVEDRKEKGSSINDGFYFLRMREEKKPEEKKGLL